MTTDDPAPESARLQLAAIADRVVSRMPGVALTDGPDGRWQTIDRHHRFRGLTAVTDGTGAFELSLHVIVSWPPDPLTSLAADLRRRIQTAVKRDGLAARLGPVEIHIAGVEDPTDDGERKS